MEEPPVAPRRNRVPSDASIGTNSLVGSVLPRPQTRTSVIRTLDSLDEISAQSGDLRGSSRSMSWELGTDSERAPPRSSRSSALPRFSAKLSLPGHLVLPPSQSEMSRSNSSPSFHISQSMGDLPVSDAVAGVSDDTPRRASIESRGSFSGLASKTYADGRRDGGGGTGSAARGGSYNQQNRPISPSVDQLSARQKQQMRQSDVKGRPGTYIPQAAFYPLQQKSTMTLTEVLENLETNIERGLTSEEASERTTSTSGSTLQEIKGTLLDATLRNTVRRVRREGVERSLSQLELVPGDIVILAAGDVVPSDCYIASISKNPNIIYRRNVPDYGDYVAPYVSGNTTDPRNKQAAGLPGPLAGYPPDPAGMDLEDHSIDSIRSTAEHSRTRQKIRQILEFLEDLNTKDQFDNTKKFNADFSGVQQTSTGWDDGVRACLPVAKEGYIAAHGDVVQWGECTCIVLAEPIESSWMMIWKNEMKKRAARLADIDLKAEGTSRTKQIVYRHKVTQRLIQIGDRGLVVTVPCVGHIVQNITVLVLDDDFRFLPPLDDTDANNPFKVPVDKDSDGIVIGTRHHATELKRRYGDLFHLAQRAGVVVCVMLRNSNASPNDANRLSKYLRFGICTANNSTFDFQTPPLDTMFTVGGVIRQLQMSDGEPLHPESLAAGIPRLEPKPTGVIGHIANAQIRMGQEPSWRPQNILTTADVTRSVVKRRFKNLAREIIQEPKSADKHHQLVAYVGEDWAALSVADVGITWESSDSPGAFEARQLANILLPSNSPRDLLRALGELTLDSVMRDNPVSEKCSVS